MDEVNRRILAYIFGGIVGTLMIYIGAKAVAHDLPLEDLLLIEGILGSIEAGFLMLIRYNFKLKIGDGKIPEGVLPEEIKVDTIAVPEPIEDPTPESAVIDPPVPE